MSEFIAMGGYAFYVWSSLAITAGVLIWNLISPIQHRKALLRDVAGQIARSNRKNAKDR